MNIVLVGCGKMGLPLAALMASRGHQVTGVDVLQDTVDSINKGVCPFEEPGVNELVAETVAAGNLRATTRMDEAVPGANGIIVIVPVVLTPERSAELSIITAVARDIAKVLEPGQTVSFETTLPVGTTRHVLTPILEESGLKAEKDFFVVFSPERVKSLKVMQHLTKTPKVIGGYGPASLEKGLAMYGSFLDEITGVDSLEHAEMVKLAGMLYRDVNIGLANELARYCETLGLDAGAIFREANTDNETSMLLPGIGVGGHCTPVYPYFVLGDERAGEQTLARNARRINDEQALHCSERLAGALNGLNGKKVVILGLAFRPDIKEDTCSTGYLVRDALAGLGAVPLMHDPLFTAEEMAAKGFTPFDGDWQDVEGAVLVTAHSAFQELDLETMAAGGVKAIFDGRNALGAEAIRVHGMRYLAVGLG